MSGYKASSLRFLLCMFCLLGAAGCTSSSSNFLNDASYDAESTKGSNVLTPANVIAP